MSSLDIEVTIPSYSVSVTLSQTREATGSTLSQVSENSTNTAKSLYTQTEGVPVDFRGTAGVKFSSDADSYLHLYSEAEIQYIDFTNRVVLGSGLGSSNAALSLDNNTGSNNSLAIIGTGSSNAIRFDDTGGISRNAIYVDGTSNDLIIGNDNYSGIELIGDIKEAGNITFKTGATGGTFRTGESNADKWQLQAYDVNDSMYRTVASAHAGNEVLFHLFDDYLRVTDSTDTSKRASFDASGITTDTTREYTFPDKDGTLAVTSDLTDKIEDDSTDTLTNKRIQPRTSTSASGDITPDLATANVWQRTAISADITINAPTGTPVLGEVLVFLLSTDGTARTLTMNAAFIAYGAAFPSEIAADKDMIITAQFNGTNWVTLVAEEI